MADGEQRHCAYGLAIAVTKLLLIAVTLPIIAASFAGASPATAFTLLSSAFIIEYGAALVGIALGLNPVLVVFILCCVAFGVTLFIFDILGIIGDRSERVRHFFERSAERGRKSRILSRYGIYGLVPCVMTLGCYACPPVSCVFGWDRQTSVLLIMAGYLIVSVVSVLLTLGVFSVFFG